MWDLHTRSRSKSSPQPFESNILWLITVWGRSGRCNDGKGAAWLSLYSAGTVKLGQGRCCLWENQALDHSASLKEFSSTYTLPFCSLPLPC